MSAVAPLDVRARSEARPHAPTDRLTGLVLTLAGLAGGLAAFALILDRIALLENPAFVPACDVNAVVSCGSIMASPQSELFGFPNPLIGLVAFPVVTTLGVLVRAGVALPRWVWGGLLAGSTAGSVLVAWLIVQSLYVIGALCPYCMVVWVATLAITWYVLLRNLRQGSSRDVPAVRVALDYHSTVLVVVLVGIAALVLARFGSSLLS